MPRISIVLSLTDKALAAPAALLAALHRQSFRDVEIIYVYPRDGHRHQVGYAKARSPLVYFLDADCLPVAPDHLELLISRFMRQPRLAGMGGPYLNAAGASYWDEAYHCLCKAWILASRRSGSGGLSEVTNLLGGNFALNKSLIGPLLPSSSEVIWGGEETLLLRKLQRLGFRFGYDEALGVQHLPNSSLRHWLRRAWLHGRNRRRLELETKTTAVGPIWARSVPARFWPAVGAHLLTVKAAYHLTSPRPPEDL